MIKSNKPITSATFILLLVAIIIAAAYCHEPIVTRYHISNLGEEGVPAENAIEYLSKKDGDITKYMIEIAAKNTGMKRYNAIRVLEKKGALNALPETVRLNYLLIKLFLSNDKSLGRAFEQAFGTPFIVAPSLYKSVGDAVGPENLHHEFILGATGVGIRDINGLKIVSTIDEFESASSYRVGFAARVLLMNAPQALGLPVVAPFLCYKIQGVKAYMATPAEVFRAFQENNPMIFRVEPFSGNTADLTQHKVWVNIPSFSWSHLPIIASFTNFEIVFDGGEIVLRQR